MQSVMKTMAVGAILAIGMGAAVATAAANPFVGTWSMNNAKSTSTGTDPSPRSQIRVYSESEQGVVLTTTTTAADGKKSTDIGKPVKWDGMPHADTGGGAGADTVAVKRLGERMVEYTISKAGTTIQSGTAAVSDDGKSLTFYGKATGAKGEQIAYHQVYDRK
jgi:uncharacterized Zn-binding protein involved in type VI secretion